MFDLNPLYKKKANKDDEPSKVGSLYKILAADDLLSDPAFKHLIKDLEDQIIIPKKNFEDLYLVTIFKYAEFIQSLPNIKHPNFEFEKGQLLLAILRSNLTIREAENYSCPRVNHKTKSARSEEKRMALWQYIIFSSALFLDIGSNLTALDVETCQSNFENKKIWVPVNGEMSTDNNTHYTFRSKPAAEPAYTNKLNLLFATSIIPKYILSWLYTESDLFFEWLALLEDQATGSGTLHKLTVVSLRKFINEYLGSHLPNNILKLIPKHIIPNNQYHKDSFWKGVEHSLRGEKSLPRDAEQNYGIEFLAWLKEGVQSKSLSVNQKQSKIHVSDDGLFLVSPEIFLEFSKQSPKHTNWQTVFKHLLQLDVIKHAGDSNLYECHFPNLNSPITKYGILIKDRSLIYGNEAMPSLSPQIDVGTLKPVSNSAIFPSPRLREEIGIAAYMRSIYNPKPL